MAERDLPRGELEAHDVSARFSRRVDGRFAFRRPPALNGADAGPAPHRGETEPEPDSPVVYVVDDDPSVRRALRRLFRTVGLSAETFSSAEAFLDHPIPARPTCLVLDVRLPGPSGLDVQAALAGAEHAVSIVFITGYSDVPSSVRAMKACAVDFLQKPFDDAALLRSVEQALARSRAALAERLARAHVQQHLDTLTARERHVLMEVVAGKLNKQIASDLGIAEKTVKVHRGRVMQKMRVDSVVELARLVEKSGAASA